MFGHSVSFRVKSVGRLAAKALASHHAPSIAHDGDEQSGESVLVFGSGCTGSMKLPGPAGATQSIPCTEHRDLRQWSTSAGKEYYSAWSSLTQKERCY